MSEDGRKWFGELPTRWTAAPIGHHFEVTLGKMINARTEVSDAISAPYLTAGSIQPEHLVLDDTKRMNFSKAELRKYALKRDDIVVVEGGAGYGRSHLLKTDLVGWGFQNHVARVRQRSGSVMPGFLVYCLKACLASGYIEANNRTATLPSLSREVLNTITAPVPTLDEQRAIAHYLNQETAQIDALVAKQEEFVGLLRERRDAVVRAETQQLTGVFPVDKLGRSARVGNGSTPRRDKDEYWRDGDVPWLTSAAVNLPEVVSADQFVTELAVRECHLPAVKPGVLLIGLIGQGPTRGMTTISRVRATLSQNLAYIAPDETKWVPEYMAWALRASYQEIRQKGAESGAAQGMLNTDDIRRVRLAMPTITEQKRIVARLKEQTAKIDALITKTEEHIALVQERRSALITTAVTGRIDVRTAGKAG